MFVKKNLNAIEDFTEIIDFRYKFCEIEQALDEEYEH